MRLVRRILRLAGGLCALLVLAACGTSKVDEGITTASLAESKRAVAIMRIGAASFACRHVALLLGVAEGRGFRHHRGVRVMDVASQITLPIAEIELAPGTYHVVAYACATQSKAGVVGDKTDPGLYGRSFASFTVGPGEIVNVGYLHLHASRTGLNAFGRPVRTEIEITDWPLAELDRFKAQRPRLYAQMVTRLMTVTPVPAGPTGDECARLRGLQAEGKVQTLPEACAPAAAETAAAPAAAPARVPPRGR